MAKRTYTQEEVDAILSRAIDRQASEAGKLSHEDLVAAAGEVGIPREAVESAARDVTSPSPQETSDEAIVNRWNRRAWQRFLRHVVVFVIVMAMLAFINMTTSAAFLWFPIVFFGWGIGVAMNLLAILFADPERIVEQERRRQERRARRQRWKHRGEEFEKAVSEGVRVFLEAANKQHARVRVDAPSSPAEADPLSEREADEEDHKRRA